MIIYIDMDDVLCDFSGAHAQALKATPGIAFPQSQHGFFSGLKPLEGAIDAVLALIESPQYNPYILTAPSTRNPFSYTEKRVWIESMFGYEFVKKLIICANKGLLKGSILVDDNVSGKGQEDFEGKLIQYGSGQYQNWASIRNELGV